jgi:hypothetical protein
LSRRKTFFKWTNCTMRNMLAKWKEQSMKNFIRIKIATLSR